MLVVMQRQASEKDIERVLKKISEMGLKPHSMPGPTRTAIGITGNTAAIEATTLSSLPSVLELIRVTKPYKLASREMHIDDSQVIFPQCTIGAPNFTVIAGPCSVENEEMILRTAEFLRERGIGIMRAGAFKPRTSPYSFQGLERAGLEMLCRAREKTGIAIVTEVLDVENADLVEQAADMLQVGTRNMQNFSLLKRLGQARKPVLLKRGMAATLEEWLMAAEYVLTGGNSDVILCERGVRTFTDHTRNTLDLSVIPPAKELSHLPVIVDPSHGTGRRAYVTPMAMAGMAAGADGVIVEVHPDPESALSDGAQSLDFGQFDKMLKELKRLADVLGRQVDGT